MSKTKRNFYGNVGDVEMPPLGYQLPEEGAQPVTQPEQQPINQAFAVPDQVPVETQQAMEEIDDEIEEVDQEETEVEQDVVAKVAKVPVKKQEENFKAIREAKERAEKDRARAEAERDLLLSKLVELQNSSPKQKIQEEIVEPVDQDFDFNMNDDDLLEGKHAKKLIAELKKMKADLKSYKTQSYNTSVEAKIKANFPDFDQVVSQDNVAILNQEEPELAASLRDTQDIYTKAAAAYKAIKRMGIYKDESVFMKEKEIAIVNSKKPRPLTSVNPQQGDSPLSKANAFANGLTPELREQLRREMYDARKGH